MDTVLDLFSGPGGLGTGFTQHFQVELAVDWDEDACETYSENHPETDVKHQDVRDLDYVHLRYTERNHLGVRFEPWHIKVM